MSAHHGLVDPPCAGLEDAPEGVDREVVADVVPAVDVGVERVDRAQHRGHLAARVAVWAVRVVHERQPHGAVGGSDTGHRATLGPGPAGDDRRLARACLQER